MILFFLMGGLFFSNWSARKLSDTSYDVTRSWFSFLPRAMRNPAFWILEANSLWFEIWSSLTIVHAHSLTPPPVDSHLISSQISKFQVREIGKILHYFNLLIIVSGCQFFLSTSLFRSQSFLLPNMQALFKRWIQNGAEFVASSGALRSCDVSEYYWLAHCLFHWSQW